MAFEEFPVSARITSVRVAVHAGARWVEIRIHIDLFEKIRVDDSRRVRVDIGRGEDAGIIAVAGDQSGLGRKLFFAGRSKVGGLRLPLWVLGWRAKRPAIMPARDVKWEVVDGRLIVKLPEELWKGAE